jgi:hypothetical protein
MRDPIKTRHHKTIHYGAIGSKYCLFKFYTLEDDERWEGEWAVEAWLEHTTHHSEVRTYNVIVGPFGSDIFPMDGISRLTEGWIFDQCMKFEKELSPVQEEF